MEVTLAARIESWNDWPQVVARLLAAHPQPDELTEQLTQQLATQAPFALVVACRLARDGRLVTVACRRDEEPIQHERASALIDLLLSEINPAVISAPIRDDGLLLLVVPDELAAADKGLVRVLLRLSAEVLAAQLQAEAANRRLHDLEQEQCDLANLAMVGDAMLELTHDLNNHLNGMMLQTAVVQMQVTEPLKAELASVRREGTAAAGRLRMLLRCRDQRRQQRRTLDLNDALRDTQALRAVSSVRYGTDLPGISAQPADVRRLVAVLVQCFALPPGSGDATLQVETLRRGDEACLHFKLAGGPNAQELNALLDPRLAEGDMERELRTMALRSLLKQTGARLICEDGDSGGATVAIAWK